MRFKSGIIGLALTCIGLNAYAFSSDYTDIAIAGDAFPETWDVTANLLTLESDYTWGGTVHVLSTSGSFKFAANQTWTTNWGGNFTFLHVPALDLGSLSQNGNNISFSGIATGLYSVTFHEQTATFDFAPVSPAPNPTAVQLIGSFNGDGATSVGTMTNTAGYVWTTSVDLDADANLFFKVATAAGTNNWGALTATDITSMPFSGGNPCGSARYTLNGVTGGTFVVTFNLESNTFGIVRIATNNFVLSTVTAVGDFVGGNPPDINLEKISGTLWQSDFITTNASRFSLSFIGRDAIGDVGRYWGMTNLFTNTLPATGFMLSSSNNIHTNTVCTAPPGSYRIRFDSASGEFSVQQRYTTASGINYLQNPSFEDVAFGSPSQWTPYHATSGDQASFGAHSGTRCGVLLAKTTPSDPDFGNFDQTTSTLTGLSGQTFRVSAAFRTKGVWTASLVRIIVEWKDADFNTVSEQAAEVTGLNEQWQIHALEAIVPSNSIRAKILLKYDGVPGTGYLLVDDAEARIAASRFQDFNAWGLINQFTNLSPDWAVTSGRTILNAADSGPTGGVIIAKYIEGSDNNKAIEIFNGTGATNDLLANQYYLQQYNNGSPTATVSMALSGILPPGESLVISRPALPTNAFPPSSEIINSDGVHLQTNAVTFNGDDVIVLRRGGASGPIADRVGQVGTNTTGSLWARFAQNHSLSRKPSVLWGVTNNPTNSFSLSEWTINPQDDFAELGIHYFSTDDPGAPYKPTGYSLLLNTNASLLTPELDGGIGDISFYARAEGSLAGAPIQLAVESATSQTSTNWTLLDTLVIPLTTTNFIRFASFSSPSDHDVVRIRHIGDGSTNRIRIDDVLVDEAYSIKRSQNFAAWTNFLGAPIGTYSIAEWTIENAQVSSNGPYGNTTADLHPDSGFVSSPHFEGGVGTVNFWLAKHPDSTNDEVRAHVLTSTNNWATWTTNASVGLPAITPQTNILSSNFSVAIYLPVPSAARISADGSPSAFVVDNIEVRIPYLSRTLTFNDFSLDSGYKDYVKDSWDITETAIVTNPVYSGYSGRMRNATITSPHFDEIGTISFYYLLSEYSGDSTARLTVEISPDANSWTVLDSGIAPSASPQMYSFYNTNTTYHYVRIRQTTSGKRMLIDQINIGEPAPAPSCTITAGLSPATPAPDEGFYVTADVVANNGADILAVTGSYRIASGLWTNLPMSPVSFGSYRSALLPPLPAGVKITYRAYVSYGGIGAAPGSTSYSTNQAYSTTNFVYVSDVPRGTVWINELFYAPYEGEEGGGGIWGDTPYNHEFVELCGVAGTSIGNWQVQLLLCSAADIQANTGQAVYAAYTIPGGTVLADATNSFGFYVIGDAELATNVPPPPVDQNLTTLVPSNVNPYAAVDLDHIRDPSGIVRLVDNYGNVVYSLSYGAYQTGSDRIPATQSLVSNTNSLSLSGTGSVYSAFAWDDEHPLTIGAENNGQTLLPDSGLPLMGAWHTPAAIAETSLQGTFTQFSPSDAAQSDTLNIHYAYTNSAFTYASINGITHHHKQGATGTWNTAGKQVDFPGNFDTNGVAYLRMTIPAYAYDRLDTLEYVIEAIPPGGSGLATAYLGRDGQGSSTAYTNLATAQLYPFQYTFPIADVFEITKFTIVSNTILRLETDGNDTQDPIQNFRVLFTTNLLTPPVLWNAMTPQSNSRTNEQNYLGLTNPPGIQNYFSIEPLWP